MPALLSARLAHFAAALWWGSLSAVGFMAVPLLFKFLPTPVLAGNMAARLFTAQTWLSVACGMALLLASRPDDMTAPARRARGMLAWVLLGILLALLLEFGVAPRIVARQNLALWHGVGSVMYAAQWLCAALVLWRVGGAQGESS